MNNQLFNLDNPVLNRDNSLQPYANLRNVLKSQGVSLDTVDVGDEENCEKIIIFDLSKENYLYLKRCIKKGWQNKLMLVMWEGPVIVRRNWDTSFHQYFTKIFTWNDDLVDEKKYFKIFYPQPELPFYGFKVPFQEKKFCTFISSNKMSNRKGSIYSERIKAIHFFEKNHPDKFDLYGIGWNKPKTKLQRWFPFLTPQYKTYKGDVLEKGAVFSKYKFAICYENQCVKGYITEKIFDCFHGGCVPIYLGADNIAQYIPSNTFIDKRNFATYEELMNFLERIDEKQYNQYIENIKDYLNSEQCKQFSTENYINIMVNQLL